MSPTDTADTAGRERYGVAALAACVDATRTWACLHLAAQHALTGAVHAATPGHDGVLSAGTRAHTRGVLLAHGLVYRDGPLLRVSRRGVQTAAWVNWLASGRSLDDAIDTVFDQLAAL